MELSEITLPPFLKGWYYLRTLALGVTVIGAIGFLTNTYFVEKDNSVRLFFTLLFTSIFVIPIGMIVSLLLIKSRDKVMEGSGRFLVLVADLVVLFGGLIVIQEISTSSNSDSIMFLGLVFLFPVFSVFVLFIDRGSKLYFNEIKLAYDY